MAAAATLICAHWDGGLCFVLRQQNVPENDGLVLVADFFCGAGGLAYIFRP
jgi:hypothetical protein